MINIAIFASGSGSNAENLINYFRQHFNIRVCVVLTNNSQAGVIARAQSANVPIHIFNRNEFYDTENILEKLKELQIDYIVLAGFLWLIPTYLIENFSQHILNIHPALLPKYGGKGMYGMNVHRAVIENHEKQSGITIHEVDKEYDRGKIIFQATCDILPDDTPENLAAKIHELEYLHFPAIVENWIVANNRDCRE